MKMIPLTQGKVALVDDDDFNRLKVFNWYANKVGKRFYAASKPGPRVSRKILMHREIMQPGPGLEIDHIDGNSLNNQRINLRSVSRLQNTQAFRAKRGGVTSSFRGISWDIRRANWRAQIKVEGRGIFLGRFNLEEDAARAYDKAARLYFGEFAHLNFP